MTCYKIFAEGQLWIDKGQLWIERGQLWIDKGQLWIDCAEKFNWPCIVELLLQISLLFVYSINTLHLFLEFWMSSKLTEECVDDWVWRW